MENETETLDSSIEKTTADAETATGDLDNLDATALKELVQTERNKTKDVSEKNRQLFARAKKAEGFELKDGDWVKPAPEEKSKAKKEAKS